MFKRLDELFGAFAESELAAMLCCGLAGTCLGFVIGLALRWPQ